MTACNSVRNDRFLYLIPGWLWLLRECYDLNIAAECAFIHLTTLQESLRCQFLVHLLPTKSLGSIVRPQTQPRQSTYWCRTSLWWTCQSSTLTVVTYMCLPCLTLDILLSPRWHKNIPLLWFLFSNVALGYGLFITGGFVSIGAPLFIHKHWFLNHGDKLTHLQH